MERVPPDPGAEVGLGVMGKLLFINFYLCKILSLCPRGLRSRSEVGRQNYPVLCS